VGIKEQQALTKAAEATIAALRAEARRLREVAYALASREHQRDHEALPAFADCRFAPCPEHRAALAAAASEPDTRCGGCGKTQTPTHKCPARPSGSENPSDSAPWQS